MALRLRDFLCSSCDKINEELVVERNGLPTTEQICCNECSKPMKQVAISKSNFVLKGKGWYKSGGY